MCIVVCGLYVEVAFEFILCFFFEDFHINQNNHYDCKYMHAFKLLHNVAKIENH